MAYDASTDYRAIQNALKKQMEETTDEQEQAQLQAQWDAAEQSRTEKLASNLSQYGKWASDSELDSAAGVMAQNQIGTGFETQKSNLNKSYDQAKQNASNDALSRGMARSSFVQDRSANLDSERANSLSNIDASKTLALQNAKTNIIDRYQANEANKLANQKNEFAQNIGAYYNDFQQEINNIQGNGDPSDDWKVPYLQAARNQKIQGNAELNMQYGDFSGATGLSPTALSNAQKIWDYNNSNVFAPTYSYSGGSSKTYSGGGTTPVGDPPKIEDEFNSAYSPYGVIQDIEALKKQGYTSAQIKSNAKKAHSNGQISDDQYQFYVQYSGNGSTRTQYLGGNSKKK